MKKITFILFLLMLIFHAGMYSQPGSASATYSAGDIPTDHPFNATTAAAGSSCSAQLVVTIPVDKIITSIDVSYTMTAAADGWMAEQRSRITVTNPGGASESGPNFGYYPGSGTTAGLFSYERTGLTIGAGVSGGGDITFRMDAFRTYFGDTGEGLCGTLDNKVDDNSWTVTVYYDDIPSCLFPNTLAAGNFTATSADLSWTDPAAVGLYDIEFLDITAGDVVTGNPTDVGVSNPYTKTGLIGSNAYRYYVRADCGTDGVSDWAGPFNFILPPSNDDCSGVIDLGTQTSPLSGTTVGATNDFNQNCLTNAGAPDIVYSILVPANFTLDIRQTVNSYDSKHRLAYGNSCPGDNLIVCTDDPDTQQESWTNNTGQDQTVYWIQSAFSTANGTFTLEWSLTAPPTCIVPSELAAGNFTSTSAELSWTDAGAAGLYDVEFLDVTAGDTVTGTPTDSGVANPYTKSGLTEGNDYAFYVRADCGGDGTSDWAGPFNFSLVLPPACGGKFYDTGGPSGNYSANENVTTTISPDVAGEAVTVTFTFVDIETASGAGNQDGCWDYLTIYDGPDTNAPVLAQTLCGEQSGDGGVPSVASSLLSVGDSFTSTHPSGALTFVFISDGSVQEGGWAADITCAALSIDDFGISNFKYFPNPVLDTLTLTAQNNIEQVTVFNMLGQVVLKQSPNTTTSIIDMNNLVSGTYFAQVSVNGIVKTVKVIKQ